MADDKISLTTVQRLGAGSSVREVVVVVTAAVPAATITGAVVELAVEREELLG